MTNPEEEPGSSTSSLPSLRGAVFAINDSHGFGYIRTPDNQRIKFLIKDFQANGEVIRLGMMLAFTVTESEDGPIARAVVPAKPDANSDVLLDEPDQKTLFDFSDDIGAGDKELAISELNDSSNPNKFYQLAIVARAENRIKEAASLFEKALAANPTPNVFSAYAKMELENGSAARAADLVDAGLAKHPTASFLYVMKGQMARRISQHNEAVKIFRQGLQHTPRDIVLRQSLALVLADIGSTASFKEADRLFGDLEREGKVNTGDQAYQRFRALRNSPRAARAYRFFDKLPGLKVGIPGRRENPEHITDLILQINNPELETTFGLAGAYILRCFDRQPQKKEIQSLLTFLRAPTSQTTIGLAAGKEVSINASLAFVVVPGTGAVRDQFMSVLSENNEALIPLDDGNLEARSRRALELFRRLLAQFLGSRDLYLSTLPVSGRRFFGREKLLAQLADKIHSGEFLGVFGLRKMGKTSLVHQLRDEKLRDEAVAYIDLQASPSLILRTFGPIYWEIERELQNRVGNRSGPKKIFRLAAYDRFSDIPYDDARIALIFSEDLRELLDLVASKKVKGVRRVVIVLDELERILPLGNQSSIAGYIEFFSLLRGLAQTEVYRMRPAVPH